MDNDNVEAEDLLPPLPWVVTIETFLNEEECKRLIEHGEASGYVPSAVYTYNKDGRVDDGRYKV